MMIAHMKCDVFKRPVRDTGINARTIPSETCDWIENRRLAHVPIAEVGELVPVRVGAFILAQFLERELVHSDIVAVPRKELADIIYGIRG